MSSPIPPDPYEALGVNKDADGNAIRIAHRKLALKHHPDRIRDEAERERGKNEFQKIQQAYEILMDPNRRARYDERVKLAELRKERMMRQSSQTTSSTMPTSAAGRRDRGGEEPYYEYVGRVPQPQASYFDRDPYEDHVPRAATRKAEPYEKKSTPPKAERREKVSSSKFSGPMDGVSYKISGQMKTKANEARMRAKENQRNAELRDKEKRRDRSDKQFGRRGGYDVDDSDSDYETIHPDHFPRSRPEPRYEHSEPATETIRGPIPRPSRRPPAYDDEDSHDESKKWERHHQNSRDYIAESQQRPGMSRSGSDAHVYWGGGDTKGGRKSGSDSEKRSSRTKSRRTTTDDSRPRPAMPVHSSAPSNLRSAVDREPVRSKTSAYPTERESRREPPSLNRSQTLPVRQKKEGNVPSRGSNLKHSEVQPDSGYYSSSNPHTPEMRGDSPPRDSRDTVRGPAKRIPTSTKYSIVDPASDDESIQRGPRIHRRVLNQDEDRSRIYHSPERVSARDKDRDSDRERPRERAARPALHKLDTDGGRTRSARTPPSMARPEFGRYESQSPREGHSAKLFGEMGDRPPSSYTRPPPQTVRTSSYRNPVYSEHRKTSPNDYADSGFRQSSNYPTTSRRSSTANAF